MSIPKWDAHPKKVTSWQAAVHPGTHRIWLPLAAAAYRLYPETVVVRLHGSRGNVVHGLTSPGNIRAPETSEPINGGRKDLPQRDTPQPIPAIAVKTKLLNRTVSLHGSLNIYVQPPKTLAAIRGLTGKQTGFHRRKGQAGIFIRLLKILRPQRRGYPPRAQQTPQAHSQQQGSQPHADKSYRPLSALRRGRSGWFPRGRSRRSGRISRFRGNRRIMAFQRN